MGNITYQDFGKTCSGNKRATFTCHNERNEKRNCKVGNRGHEGGLWTGSVEREGVKSDWLPILILFNTFSVT